MDLAFTFTYLSLRCMSNEVEICALSTSMRQDALGALGRAVAALEGIAVSKESRISNTGKEAIGFLNSLEYVAMREDDKIQGISSEVIHTHVIAGGGCPERSQWRRMRDLNPR